MQNFIVLLFKDPTNWKPLNGVARDFLTFRSFETYLEQRLRIYRFETFLRAAIFYEDPKHTPSCSRPLSVEGLEVDLWSSLYWFSPQPTVRPYRATSCRVILHSDSTYDGVTRPEDDFYWHSVSLDLSAIDNASPRSPYLGNRASSILYDRAANLSVVIRNSAEQEMNLTPVSVPSLFFLLSCHFFPVPIMFSITARLCFYYPNVLFSFMKNLYI